MEYLNIDADYVWSAGRLDTDGAVSSAGSRFHTIPAEPFILLPLHMAADGNGTTLELSVCMYLGTRGAELGSVALGRARGRCVLIGIARPSPRL